MSVMSDGLLRRIAERAADPNRRYKSAAEDQSKVELSVDEIEERFVDWQRRNDEQARTAAIRDGMTPEEFDEQARKDRELEAKHSPLGSSNIFQAMIERMRAQGMDPKTMSFVENDGHVSASTQPKGATPLTPGPSPEDWATLEATVGRPMPEDLRRLYSVSNGGFGPGLTGLKSLETIAVDYQDFRRRGPDYCGSIDYPASFVPLAFDALDYHYDLDTGRIISSNAYWENDELDREDIYDIAFQSLADMMEDWLARS
jgi:hypothetical protein